MLCSPSAASGPWGAPGRNSSLAGPVPLPAFHFCPPGFGPISLDTTVSCFPDAEPCGEPGSPCTLASEPGSVSAARLPIGDEFPSEGLDGKGSSVPSLHHYQQYNPLLVGKKSPLQEGTSKISLRVTPSAGGCLSPALDPG